MQVRLYATLRAIAGARRVEIVGDNATVGEVLRQLIAAHPGLAELLLTADGEVRPYVAVIVQGRDIRHTGGLETPVTAESELDIFPPVAGGRVVARETGDPRPARVADPRLPGGDGRCG